MEVQIFYYLYIHVHKCKLHAWSHIEIKAQAYFCVECSTLNILPTIFMEWGWGWGWGMYWTASLMWVIDSCSKWLTCTWCIREVMRIMEFFSMVSCAREWETHFVVTKNVHVLTCIRLQVQLMHGVVINRWRKIWVVHDTDNEGIFIVKYCSSGGFLALSS